jgi:hypothetical protein
VRAQARVVVVAALAAALVACPAKPGARSTRTLYFRGEPVARIEERVTQSGATRRVTREAHLGGEDVIIDATLDADGFVVDATYGRGAVRELRLGGGRLVDVKAGTARAVEGPLLLLELLHDVQPRARTEVSFVDLASGDVMRGTVERRAAALVASTSSGAVLARVNVEGQRTGPGAFVEGDAAASIDTAPVDVPFPSTVARGVRFVGIDDVLKDLALDGPGQRHGLPAEGPVAFWDDAGTSRAPGPDDTKPALFLESDAPAVRAFANSHAYSQTGVDLAAVNAARLVEAIHPLVDANKRDVPPSALNMLTFGGDCDGAAALLTASLRALGHPARPVVGYRLVDGRFVPHAWVEVYTSGGWMQVDAAAQKVGNDRAHLKLFEGLGSAFGMGRVLGRLRLEPIP